MSQSVHHISTPQRMHEFGVEFGRRLVAGDIVVLTGPLGAGKTTLTRGIGEGVGVRGPVTSPTFVLARTHPHLSGGVPLVHVDAYRLSDARELDDLDIDFANSVVVVEWGAGVIESLAEDWTELVIERPMGDIGVHISVGDSDQEAEADLDGPSPRTVTVIEHHSGASA